MNKRIRYNKRGEGIFVSSKVIETASGEVTVQYNVNNRVVQILSATEPIRLIDTFVSGNDHQLKMDIKKRLIALGAVFADETRNRDKSPSLEE
jgi:vacuolar-type H+-ATPase subunit B/Vma2